MTQGVLGLWIVLGITILCCAGGIINKMIRGNFFEGAVFTFLGLDAIFLLVGLVVVLAKTWSLPL